MAGEDHNNDRMPDFAPLLKDTVIGHYKIIKNIGVGGMGEVYLAEDAMLDRRVALKFLPRQFISDKDAKARFKREAQAAARLDHSNIVTIYEVSEHLGRPFLAMQHVEGQSLQDSIKEKELPINAVIDLLIQICQGLREAHEAGIVHRDIKPSNIILDRNGRPKLLDFGLATIRGAERLTKSGSTLGTIGYMSPEQIRGDEIDARSDLFSLGVVLYEMITGRAPFAAEYDAAVMHSILHETPEPLEQYRSDIHIGIQGIIDRAMDKDPQTRYQHVDDLLADLKRVRREMVSGHEESSVGSYRARSPGMYAVLKRFGIPALAVLPVLLIIFLGRYTWLNILGISTTDGARHLAVLPLKNIGEHADKMAFCDGLSEVLSSKLTQLEKFQGSSWIIPASEVVARNVTSAGDARLAFGVDQIVTGSVQHFDGSIRITLNLIDAENGWQLRSVVMDSPLDNASTLQDSIVIAAAEMLDAEIGPDLRRRLTAGGTMSSEAYNFYVRGQGFLQHYEKAENIDTAIALFRLALNHDSQYPLAYAGLAEAYWRKFRAAEDPRWVDIAINNCQRALDLDDQLPVAYVALGRIYKETGQYEKAASAFSQALKLDPYSSIACRGLATAYEALNKIELADSTYRKAIELRPNYWGGYFDLGFFYRMLGRHQQALEQLRLATALSPVAVYPYNDLGGLYFALGIRDVARDMWERSLAIEPNYAAYSNLGALYFMEMRYSDAAGMYEKALKLDSSSHVVLENLAYAYYWMPGHRDKALEMYLRVIEMAERLREVNPKDPDLLSRLAECYAFTGERRKARLYIEKAILLSPNNILITADACSVYEIIGDRNKALECIGKAIKTGYLPDDIRRLPELSELVADPRFEELLEESENKL